MTSKEIENEYTEYDAACLPIECKQCAWNCISDCIYTYYMLKECETCNNIVCCECEYLRNAAIDESAATEIG